MLRELLLCARVLQRGVDGHGRYWLPLLRPPTPCSTVAWRHGHVGTMTKKAARSKGNSSDQSDGEAPSHDAGGGDVSLSSLSPKPCITCGRVITPRAKWQRNWASIRTCSDSCKGSKPGSKGSSFSSKLPADADQSALEGVLASLSQSPDKMAVQLARCTSLVAPMPPPDTLRLLVINVDAWIELCLLQAAPRPSQQRDLPTGETVEEGLLETARSFDTNTSNALDGHVVAFAEDIRGAGPGLRERIRRSLRRLFVLDRSDWACSDLIDGDKGVTGLTLLQNGKNLDGLHGASFAKGPISFRIRS